MSTRVERIPPAVSRVGRIAAAVPAWAWVVGAVAVCSYVAILAVAVPSLVAEARDVLRRRRGGAVEPTPDPPVATESEA